ncbi:MAG: alpha/beta hydrolase, partial [Chloroflexota bacterium]
DAVALAHDLHSLLVASGNSGPYVLAGHSAGGLYVRVFAATYPNEVAGVVLLDAQSPHTNSASAIGEPPQSPIKTLAGMLPALARVGVARLLLSAESSDLPPEFEAPRHAQEVTAKGVSSFVTEFIELDHIQGAVAVLPDLGDRPLVVVTAVAEALGGWLDQQDRLATLSTNVSHRVFPDLTHVSLIESERGALASSEAIQSVVQAIRSGTSLDGLTAGHQ